MAVLTLLLALPFSAYAVMTGTSTGGDASAGPSVSTGAETGDGGDASAPVIDSSIFTPDDQGPGQIEILDMTDSQTQDATGQVQAPAQQLGGDDSHKDYISGALPAVITDKLPRFGYRFFSNPKTGFAPLRNVPVGPDYVVGPGDTIRIDIWGLEEGHYTVPVDRNGNLSLPRAGVVGVAGLSFEQTKMAVENAYSRYYSNFQINITMGQLRTITVYVVGQTNRPGAYTLSSMSTVINALMASGGPSFAGSLRNIQVKRNDSVVSRFDAYELLLQGSKKKDIRLMDGDVLFIPTVGPLVGITGDIKNPAYYELNGQARISDLVEMAGGFTNRYFKGRVQVDRTMGNEYRTSFENDLAGLKQNSAKNIPLENGDLVKIYSVSIQESKVYLSGAVARPGQYSISLGQTRVGDVLRRAGGLLYMASNKGELTRVKVTQQGPQTSRFRFDVAQAMAGDPQNNLILDVNDYITIRTVPDWTLYRTVRVQGEVTYPGVYTIQKGERLSDLIELAGGYTTKAFLPGATFTRSSVQKKQQQRIDQMIDRLEKQLYGASVEATSTALTQTDASMTQMETEQRQRFLDRLKETRGTGRIVVKLPDNPRLLKGTPYDIELEQGDTLVIPKRPQTVQVVGSVYNPMAFVYRPDQPFTYYVKQAGGYSSSANTKRVYIIKADGTATRAYVNKKPVAIEDGDSVIVPEKIDVKGKLRDTRDIVDIVYKVAVGAAVLLD
jgi:protein involved in polysaccharide export with SLBB domain